MVLHTPGQVHKQVEEEVVVVGYKYSLQVGRLYLSLLELGLCWRDLHRRVGWSWTTHRQEYLGSLTLEYCDLVSDHSPQDLTLRYQLEEDLLGQDSCIL